MKTTLLKLSLLIFIFSTQQLLAQTTWTGSKTTFSKADGANPALEVNQDRITSNVWIARGNSGGQIYNAKSESYSSKSSSPADTQWALGTTTNLATLSFDTFRNTVSPKSVVGKDMVLHLVTDNIYIDIKFTSWSSGSSTGGGFSYQRSTNSGLSIKDVEDSTLYVFPNPTPNNLTVSGLVGSSTYSIYTILGVAIDSGTVTSNQKIDVSSLKLGLYILYLSDTSIPFVKR